MPILCPISYITMFSCLESRSKIDMGGLIPFLHRSADHWQLNAALLESAAELDAGLHHLELECGILYTCGSIITQEL